MQRTQRLKAENVRQRVSHYFSAVSAWMSHPELPQAHRTTGQVGTEGTETFVQKHNWKHVFHQPLLLQPTSSAGDELVGSKG